MGKARQRCWQYNWVLDLDIKGFFDNIPHDLLMKAVRKHTDCKWILLYIERWLKASVQQGKGMLSVRTKGTPQGAVITPRTHPQTLSFLAEYRLKEVSFNCFIKSITFMIN